MILINVFPGQMVKLLSKRKICEINEPIPQHEELEFYYRRTRPRGDCFWVPNGSVQASTKQVTLQNSGVKPPPLLSTHLTHWASFSRMCVAKEPLLSSMKPPQSPSPQESCKTFTGESPCERSADENGPDDHEPPSHQTRTPRLA